MGLGITRAALRAGVLAATAVLAVSCASPADQGTDTDTTTGGSEAGSDTTTTEASPTITTTRDPNRVALDTLLISPTMFPSDYTAEVIAPAARGEWDSLWSGVPVGAQVDPPDCAPPTLPTDPTDTAVLGAVQAAPATSRIVVILERVNEPLEDLVDRWQECDRFTVPVDGVTLAHELEVVPAPPVNAEDTAAARTTITAEDPPVELPNHQKLTLVAQQGDLRVTATQVVLGAELDTATLDQVFTESVVKAVNS